MDYSVLFMPAVTLFTALITVLQLGQFRFNTKKLFFILGLELIMQLALNCFTLILLGYQGYAWSYLLVMDIPAIITFWYISKWRDLRDMFTIIVTIFLNFTVSISALWLSNPKLNGYWKYNLIRIIIFSVIFLIIQKFLRKFYLQLQQVIEKGWGVYSILPLIGSVILYYEYLQYSINGQLYEVVIEGFITIVIMATVFAVFYYVFIQLHEKHLVQEQKRILTMQNKAQRDQFEQQRDMAEKTNRRWHDMRHNMQELIELLEAGHVDTALAYLKEQRGMDMVPTEEYCLHKGVNAILCLWAERSRKANIDVQINTDIPDQLQIEPMELSALFANAFENAYEGCLLLPKSVHKFIKVEAHYNGKRLAVGFNNSCRNDICFEGDMPVSIKKSGGIGTRSIAYTVSRFHGTKYFDAKDGMFTAKFVLNI